MKGGSEGEVRVEVRGEASLRSIQETLTAVLHLAGYDGAHPGLAIDANYTHLAHLMRLRAQVDEYILPSDGNSSSDYEEGKDDRKGPRTQKNKELGPMGTSIIVEVVDESGNIVEKRPYTGMRTLISGRQN